MAQQGRLQITDWAGLWRELVEGEECERRRLASGQPGDFDPWHDRAQDYDAMVKSRWAEADPIRGLVASRVDAETSVLDIGAGTGRWAIALSRRARHVTAIEPSEAMRAVLLENLAQEGAANVEVIEGYWPEAQVAPHDLSLCSHAMYGCPDLPDFIGRMVEVTRRECFLVLKAPLRDGIMAEASNRLWGHPHDCPDFTVAYNVLLQMGLLPNVAADPALWDPWASPSLEEALARMKKHLRVGGSAEHDEYLLDLLRRHLTLQDGQYLWPKAMRSALVYWNVAGPISFGHPPNPLG